MTDCPGACAADGAERPAAVGRQPDQLPTLQRNALRKIFDRHEFSPEEVAALGYRRLQQAEGIGNKGLAAIGDWLRRHGLELSPPPAPGNPPKPAKKSRRTIEMAVRLLRTHGYVVEAAPDAAGEAQGR